MGITEWASELIGMPDIWTALQFDNAVSLFGLWCDAKLAEYDPKTFKPIHSLEDLLTEQTHQPRTLSEWGKKFTGMRGISVRKA